jgi:hypothetical protein
MNLKSEEPLNQPSGQSPSVSQPSFGQSVINQQSITFSYSVMDRLLEVLRDTVVEDKQ